MSAVLTPTVSTSPWRPALLALGAVLLVLGGLYADTVSSMVGIWYRSETFAHAFLVPPITLWLVWRQRDALVRLTPRPQPWLLLGLAAFASLWLLADLVLVNAAAQFAWVAMLVLAVPAVLGLQVAMTILFPLLFLFFAVPIGEFMTVPMMQWTADFTVAALRWSGVPVYREGLKFVIPSGSWSVVEACSGVRYLIASFMVGTLFAYLNYQSWKRRALFMLVSILVPIVANWLRAYMIVMLGHHSGNTIAVGADHLVYGWVFFGIVVMIMFLIGARWSEPEPAPPFGPGPGAAAHNDHGAIEASAARLLPVTLAALFVLVLPHAALWGLQTLEQGAGAPRLTLPTALAGGWRSTPPASRFEPIFNSPAVKVRTGYTSAAGEVGVYLAYYRAQSDEGKLVSSVNTLLRADDPDHNQVASGTTSVALDDGRSVGWRTAHILGTQRAKGQREQLTAWRSYWVDGRWVVGDAAAKLAGAYARLLGRGDDGAVLVLWTDNASQDEARALLEKFVRENLSAIETLLAQTRDQR